MSRPVKLLKQFAELYQLLQEQPPQDVLVLTPNKRLSRYLRDGFNQYQASGQSAQAWTTPSCFSYQGWIQQVWQQLALKPEHPLLARMPLSTMQERILWQRLVSAHEETPALLSSKATGNQAMEAWRLLKQWQLEPPAVPDSNVMIFNAWSEAFARECEAKGLLASALMVDVVIDCIEQGRLPVPPRVLLYGFDEMAPQLQSLLDTMAAQGAQVEELQWQMQPQQVQRHEFADEEAEIEAAALWAQ